MTDPKRRVAAHKARSMGQSFEALIDASCERYKKMNVAMIQKTPEPFRALKKMNGGRVNGFYERQAQPDYQGTISGGRSIVFEAKHRSDDKIAKSVLSLEQEIELEYHAKMGAIVFVLVRMNNDIFRIPWSFWSTMVETFGRAHLKKEDVEQFKLSKTNGFIEFLLIDNDEVA